MKSFRTTFALVLIVIQIIPARVFANPPAEQKLRVGLIAPLTGGVATWGMSVRSAIELANSESEHPAELFTEDEETCVPNKALTAFTALESIKKIDVLIGSCLGGAQAIAPLAQRSKLPFFISGRSSSEFQAKNPNALSWISLLDYEGKAVADLITSNRWKKGTAMIWSEYFGVQFAQGIKKAVSEKKLDFGYEIIEVDPGSTPSGGDIQRFLRNKPEVVFLMMSEPSAAYVVKQLKALRYVGKIVLQSSMLQTYDPAIRANFEGALQQKFPANQQMFNDLREKIKAKQGEDVADDFVFSYDGFKTLLSEAEICRKGATLSLEECLMSRIRNEEWREGASGRFRYMKDGSTERPMVFKTITVNGFE